jgi:murein L,D-transpeptidase YafK
VAGRNPKNAYQLAMRLSYPSPADVARARRAGSDPGGDIMIHGTPVVIKP